MLPFEYYSLPNITRAERALTIQLAWPKAINTAKDFSEIPWEPLIDWYLEKDKEKEAHSVGLILENSWFPNVHEFSLGFRYYKYSWSYFIYSNRACLPENIYFKLLKDKPRSGYKTKNYKNLYGAYTDLFQAIYKTFHDYVICDYSFQRYRFIPGNNSEHLYHKAHTLLPLNITWEADTFYINEEKLESILKLLEDNKINYCWE